MFPYYLFLANKNISNNGRGSKADKLLKYILKDSRKYSKNNYLKNSIPSKYSLNT